MTKLQLAVKAFLDEAVNPIDNCDSLLDNFKNKVMSDFCCFRNDHKQKCDAFNVCQLLLNVKIAFDDELETERSQG